MATLFGRGKLYALFTATGAVLAIARELITAGWGGTFMVGGIAIVMFVALVGWGSGYFGWTDPDGKVQLALVTSFILGIIGGYRAKG